MMEQEFDQQLTLNNFMGKEPELTLEPFLAPKEPEETQIKQPEPQIQLSPEEQKKVDDFAASIDLTNSNMVLLYGAGAQKKIADFSENALEHIKTKDLGEIGQMLSDVVGELKTMEVEEDKGVFRHISKKRKPFVQYEGQI